MENIRFSFAFIFLVIFLACPCLAQEENINIDTSALQGVLATLKKTVEKLNIDNQQWVNQDKNVKEQIAQLQMQLGRLQAQGDLLNKAAAQLKEKNPGRAQQIARLEKENADLDDHIRKVEEGIRSIQMSLDSGYQEDQQLDSPRSQAAAHRQKEELRLMKMVYDSQLRQESLNKEILELEKNGPLPPAAKVQSPVMHLGLADQWDDTQLHQLEGELKDLEKNYAQFKDLMDKMTRKTQNTSLTAGQHAEEGKFQSKMDDLKRQNAQLKADLDDLRAQMIDLDKRKSYLEIMIQQSP